MRACNERSNNRVETGGAHLDENFIFGRDGVGELLIAGRLA
jgi:hypothetical protein